MAAHSLKRGHRRSPSQMENRGTGGVVILNQSRTIFTRLRSQHQIRPNMHAIIGDFTQLFEELQFHARRRHSSSSATNKSSRRFFTLKPTSSPLRTNPSCPRTSSFRSRMEDGNPKNSSAHSGIGNPNHIFYAPFEQLAGNWQAT